MAISKGSATSTLSGLMGGPSKPSTPARPTLPPRPGSSATEVMVPVTCWYLENTQANHYKFYTIFFSDQGHCFFAWGKIATAGSCKIQKFATAQDAENAGVKQAYSKAGRGYEIKQQGLKIMVPERVLQGAMDNQNVRVLDMERRRAAQDPAFVNQQQAAAKHYGDFIRTAEVLMAKASTAPIETLFDDWTALQESWAELTDLHETAATQLDLMRQMLAARLVS